MSEGSFPCYASPMSKSPLQTMDPEETLKLLEEYECTLPELYRPVDEHFERLRCPKCGSRVEKLLDTQHPFREGDPVPNFHARCVTCGCTFTTDGIIVDRGGVPEEGPNPVAGMASTDPRNDVSADLMVDQYLHSIGVRRGPSRG